LFSLVLVPKQLRRQSSVAQHTSASNRGNTINVMSVLLETSAGDIVVDLWVDAAPRACSNFLKLCKAKYYNDAQFFRVEAGFIAQTGDPTNRGDGGSCAAALCGGARYFARDQRLLSHARRGTLSMTGGNSSGNASYADSAGLMLGSQFFVTLDDGLEYLDGRHAAFGRVAEGWDAVQRIQDAFVDGDCKPYRVLRVRHTVVLDDPFADPSGFPREEDCPSPPPAQGGDGDRLGSEDELEGDGERNDVDTAERERTEARSRAEVLEMIGDISSADVVPPDNVLFVCKLNAVTQAEDLEIIFSRFGECRADILRDGTTGASLCYGFVEYSSRAAAEKAYFKLDNCLIDDRRIRVDFSQSVSKLWNARRRGERIGPMHRLGWRPVLQAAHEPQVTPMSQGTNDAIGVDRERSRKRRRWAQN
jgi:peptidyl-prolyl cis-trans isomerase-like 4